MAWQRRQFLGLIPVSALSLQFGAGPTAVADDSELPRKLINSPPVVQHPAVDGFTVTVAVSALATGWVEWGRAADQLDQTAIAHQHGLVQASDRALSVRVPLGDSLPSGGVIFYRFVAQPLAYKDAYHLQRGEPQSTPVHRLKLPDPAARRITVAIVNDTHEQPQTLLALHERLNTLAPDLLVWNGDTCNDFDAADDPLQIVLNPAKDPSRGWAAERPLLFVPGNHDVRGVRARELSAGLSGWPGQADLPYNFALRLGPIALVGLDTGEDKPDEHPVFAGTAAYEPYRQLQATWLRSAVARPEIATAPVRIAICHIPLRGLPGDNDGTSLEGYAAFSGMGAKLWLPVLRQAGFSAIISGHMHRDRIDDPTAAEPITQIVGGGPQPDRATITILRAEDQTVDLEVQDLLGRSLHRRHWTGSAS